MREKGRKRFHKRKVEWYAAQKNVVDRNQCHVSVLERGIDNVVSFKGYIIIRSGGRESVTNIVTEERSEEMREKTKNRWKIESRGWKQRQGGKK